MVSTDPMVQGLMGYNREGLSHMDKLRANKMYQCVGEITWANHHSALIGYRNLRCIEYP